LEDMDLDEAVHSCEVVAVPYMDIVLVVARSGTLQGAPSYGDGRTVGLASFDMDSNILAASVRGVLEEVELAVSSFLSQC
jgi:hypothetical protein